MASPNAGNERADDRYPNQAIVLTNRTPVASFRAGRRPVLLGSSPIHLMVAKISLGGEGDDGRNDDGNNGHDDGQHA